MNIKVIHLIRKLERINRDIEEITNLISTLQMDREYSAKLKDSLIEEYHRLKNLKKEIFKQVIFIPPEYENFIKKLFLDSNETNQETALKSEIEIHIIKDNQPQPIQYQKTVEEKNNSSKETVQKKDSIKKIHEKSKHSPFLFKFQ